MSSQVSSPEPTPGLEVEIHRIGPAEAATALDIVRAAFSDRPALDPPAAALSETVASLADRLHGDRGLMATLDGRPVGTLVLDPIGRTMYLRRFAVRPGLQGRGIAHAMIAAAVEDALARGDVEDLTVVAREELPRTVSFWEKQGFREVDRYSPNVELRRPLRTHVETAADAEEMRGLGRHLAGRLRAGDLLVLSGELGAGKTTFTQGLGEGLGVRGQVTSPTFVIARVHPSLTGGPELVHVDAYRLGSLEELDDLDLDTELDEAVTVVEWGEGLAEGLSESRLEVRILRALTTDELDGDLDPRRVEITPVGPRWHDLSADGWELP
ncbi:tRNA (adenosine(37)-N6)-threonylcarbamoyltransferase complex ATPase subunit type 1 TsaE [Nocardioides insulae]|uniref:tRNA (adenosine(37)-N6)-threonylcarbamoyltransferase complex ATPase subunit type 1 TsaE n=1 Tax=Nocardioides insulae TaxID=394734 RepID=UPI0004142392|nr:tRNA (adenosine(37)-N6)-threonylcarbamoyltransferase complex ATPase subunit type 1 TsaE [Nocardioides insulae]